MRTLPFAPFFLATHAMPAPGALRRRAARAAGIDTFGKFPTARAMPAVSHVGAHAAKHLSTRH